MEEKRTDTQNAKIWFLYVVDHHEGPYSKEEIHQKVKKGEATSTSYVWKDGMPDWTPMTEVTEFKAADGKKEKEKKEAPAKSFAPRAARSFSIGPILVLLILLGALYQAVASGMLDSTLTKIGMYEKIKAMHLPALPTKTLTKKIIPLLPKAAQKFLSPVELPEDVLPADADALVDAASGALEEGAHIAVAIAGGDVFTPSFIIAGNLPDGTKLDLHLKGREGTLLNARTFEAKTNVIFNKLISRSRPVQTPDGKPLPRGEYTVLIYDAENQLPEVSLALAAAPRKSAPSAIPPGKTVFAVESYFLGGKKDGSYEEKLKAYNDKIKTQVAAESAELKQLQATIESMANESASRFFKMTAKPAKGPAAKKQKLEWKKYHDEYVKMGSQIQQQLTPNPDRMFPTVYDETVQVWQLSEKLHQLENDFFDNKATTPDIQAQAGKTLEALNALKSTIMEKVK